MGMGQRVSICPALDGLPGRREDRAGPQLLDPDLFLPTRVPGVLEDASTPAGISVPGTETQWVGGNVWVRFLAPVPTQAPHSGRQAGERRWARRAVQRTARPDSTARSLGRWGASPRRSGPPCAKASKAWRPLVPPTTTQVSQPPRKSLGSPVHGNPRVGWPWP